MGKKTPSPDRAFRSEETFETKATFANVAMTEHFCCTEGEFGGLHVGHVEGSAVEVVVLDKKCEARLISSESFRRGVKKTDQRDRLRRYFDLSSGFDVD